MTSRIRQTFYRLFRRLPAWFRVFLVRRATPSYWVGAMCLVERSDGALLLVRQSYRRGWTLPGGLLKRNEAPALAAVRETREEVGLEVEVEDHPRVVVDPPRRRVDVVFQARLAGGEDGQRPNPVSPEILEVRWFPPDDLPVLQRETAQALAGLGRAAGPSAALD
ncbi:MAG TPA: NUDIX hydrolase [Acidimicrobiales bacterium]|nr:NUDIX hydrolase [Acidimicrobiales bacterium]